MDKKTQKECEAVLETKHYECTSALQNMNKSLIELEESNEGDSFDKATNQVEIARLKSVINQQQLQLSRINAAKSRVVSGKFGICVSCGEPISKKRLLANPTALLCIECQEEKELEAKDSKARYGGTMSLVDEENAPKGESEE